MGELGSYRTFIRRSIYMPSPLISALREYYTEDLIYEAVWVVNAAFNLVPDDVATSVASFWRAFVAQHYYSPHTTRRVAFSPKAYVVLSALKQLNAAPELVLADMMSGLRRPPIAYARHILRLPCSMMLVLAKCKAVSVPLSDEGAAWIRRTFGLRL